MLQEEKNQVQVQAQIEVEVQTEVQLQVKTQVQNQDEIEVCKYGQYHVKDPSREREVNNPLKIHISVQSIQKIPF